ncbi:hypothetical protein M153_3890007036, partial [Pseudoloma neurophilia]
MARKKIDQINIKKQKPHSEFIKILTFYTDELLKVFSLKKNDDHCLLVFPDYIQGQIIMEFLQMVFRRRKEFKFIKPEKGQRIWKKTGNSSQNNLSQDNLKNNSSQDNLKNNSS